MIGAARLRDRELVLRRGGGDHGRAEQLAHLDRREADAAAGTVHQEHLAGRELAAIDQRMMGRAVRGEKSRTLRIIEIAGHPYELRGRHHRLVDIGAVPHLDDHLVANSDARSTISLDHVAGRLHARRERQLWLELIVARRHQYVGEIDAGRADRNPHLALAQGARGDLLQPQALGRAEFAADHRASHQAARSLRRISASRISGSRSLPKYMSVLSRKMVGEPKPPRAITSSVLALS